ncbi:MAG: hypothetical protein U5R48_11150 [Gammaproteobacteria bacterium]|nr:hypothetical protein [Gammaproteobacteria bacterium]
MVRIERDDGSISEVRSSRRHLEIFETHIQNQPCLPGHGPGAGDFACYGQMSFCRHLMRVSTALTVPRIGLRRMIKGLHYQAGIPMAWE